MQFVEQHLITKGDERWQEIDQAAFRSKNLYNAGMYRVRQQFFGERTYLNYYALEKQFKQKDLLPDQQLPINVVQQVLMQVDREWRAYFAGLKAWKQTPDRFTGMPRLPHYKDKVRGRNLLVFTKSAISQRLLKQGIIKLSGLTMTIKTRICASQINQVRIVPRSHHYVVEVVYSAEPQAMEVDKDRILGIDMGIDCLATLASNQPGFVPLLVNGKSLKSVNQWYNKRVASLQAHLPKGQYTSKQIQRLTFKRNQQINHHLHLVSKRIIGVMLLSRMGTLVIGKNDGWKQNLNLGKRTNQTFVQIPHARLIKQLQYKAALVGIDVVVAEESYTSKCSFLDNEPIQKQPIYKGKRVRRSVFVASHGRSIHADVNAAYNIIRKVFPNAFQNLGASGIEGVAVHPLRANVRINDTPRPAMGL